MSATDNMNMCISIRNTTYRTNKEKKKKERRRDKDESIRSWENGAFACEMYKTKTRHEEMRWRSVLVLVVNWC